jgi:uncharacterized membrane protein (TIGR02234 family)
VPDRPGRRSLHVTVLLLVAAAAALWGSSAAVWLRPSYDTPFRGQVSVAVQGGEWQPALGPLALLALAGVAGALATGGWLRRLVGAVLAVAGGWSVVLGVRPQLGRSPEGLDDVSGAPSGGRLSDVLVIEPWTLLASLGGLLLLAAGGLLVLRAAVMPRLGGRYSAPARARREPAPDRERALWDSLDAGDDPTERPR